MKSEQSFYYINIEDLCVTGHLSDCISVMEDEYQQEDITIVFADDERITIRLSANDFGEVKDFCSFITSTLLEEGIHQFTIIFQS